MCAISIKTANGFLERLGVKGGFFYALMNAR